eukprot:m.520321 g.520321  ORF g.520321 m.520321 type:complete len:420 (-) comp21951_c0_seq14:660-1919(-)
MYTCMWESCTVRVQSIPTTLYAGEMSLFERMAHSTCVRPPILLEQQYRMHPSIAEFPSDCFYGGRVRNGVSRDERPLPRGFRWPNPDIPVAFIDCADGHEIRAEGQSLYNTEEIDAVMCIVGQLLQGGCSPQAIGVVAPYSAQVTRLRRRLCVFDHNRAEGCFVECSSVDAFQGREKDVIVISTVRANSHEHVGFLSDWRRTNVAITRARCGLVVVGHRRTLLHEPLSWAPWLRWAACRGICQGQTSCGSTARHDQALLQDHSRVLLRMSHRSLWWQPNGADAVPRRHAGKHALHDRVCEVGSLSDMDFQNRDAFLGGGLSGGGTRGGALSDDNEPPTFMTLLVWAHNVHCQRLGCKCLCSLQRRRVYVRVGVDPARLGDALTSAANWRHGATGPSNREWVAAGHARQRPWCPPSRPAH